MEKNMCTSVVCCLVPVHMFLLVFLWFPAEVTLQARCVVAVRQAVRPVGETPPTASHVKNLFSYTITSVWRSVLLRTLSRTGSANAAPQLVVSAAHSDTAQVPKHKINQDKSCY